ncbi:hypothetical protein GUJ93_ZPchr0016g2575 [Zizania palustris]|uniref:Uncharacterized protein n=1 Tax=Zizania palustris TaxID=103762 RepID=A0A8J5T9A8_ZIZPA|nr:hypothetical protein GUJ93_ZPchr0016g2575 [Zizania palustris]
MFEWKAEKCQKMSFWWAFGVPPPALGLPCRRASSRALRLNRRASSRALRPRREEGTGERGIARKSRRRGWSSPLRAHCTARGTAV